jgi:hypothetical protein
VPIYLVSLWAYIVQLSCLVNFSKNKLFDENICTFKTKNYREKKFENVRKSLSSHISPPVSAGANGLEP